MNFINYSSEEGCCFSLSGPEAVLQSTRFHPDTRPCRSPDRYSDHIPAARITGRCLPPDFLHFQHIPAKLRQAWQKSWLSLEYVSIFSSSSSSYVHYYACFFCYPPLNLLIHAHPFFRFQKPVHTAKKKPFYESVERLWSTVKFLTDTCTLPTVLTIFTSYSIRQQVWWAIPHIRMLLLFGSGIPPDSLLSLHAAVSRYEIIS